MSEHLATSQDQAGDVRSLTREFQSNRAASYILFAVIALAPLPFGSVDPLVTAVWCIALGVALAAASLRSLDKRHFLIGAGVMVVLVAYLVVLHEQLASRPFFAVPLADPIWTAAADALGATLPRSTSIVRDQPFLALGAPLAAMLCLLTSFIVCVDRQRARQLLYVVAGSGLVYAVYGIAAFAVDPTKVLWMTKQAYSTVLTSTFINRNTAAVYFGSCSILWLLILAGTVRQRLPRNARVWLFISNQWPQDLRRRIVVEFLAFFACFVAMFLTGSRAGITFSLLMGVVAFVIFAWVTLRRIPARILVLAIGALLLVTQVLGAGMIGRLDNEGLADGGRLETYRAVLAIIGNHPWLGTGLGTFAWTYPAYRPDAFSSWGIWDRAHSTPLEIAAEMGLPLAGIVVLGWLAIFSVLGFGLWTRKRDQIILIAAVAIAGLGILHSAIDFSLQIPGFALLVFGLVGAGLAQSFRSAPSPEELRRQPK